MYSIEYHDQFYSGNSCISKLVVKQYDNGSVTLDPFEVFYESERYVCRGFTNATFLRNGIFLSLVLNPADKTSYISLTSGDTGMKLEDTDDKDGCYYFGVFAWVKDNTIHLINHIRKG